MAFKMKNPSMAKMAKMAGDNRAAMKMKMESAAKMKKGGRKKTTKKKTKKKKGPTPKNPSLYAKVKAEAKKKFKVYPSADANEWLVRTYKKRGGTYA